jgi:hypothetical protein
MDLITLLGLRSLRHLFSVSLEDFPHGNYNAAAAMPDNAARRSDKSTAGLALAAKCAGLSPGRLHRVMN